VDSILAGFQPAFVSFKPCRSSKKAKHSTAWSRQSAGPHSVRASSAIRLQERRLDEREISLEPADAAKEETAEAGWDPSFGARALKRAVQHLLAAEFTAGDTMPVDAQNDEISFAKAEAPTAS